MDHDTLRALVLAREDLEGEERDIVAAHLPGCPECRELLAALKRLQAQADELGELPADPKHPLYRLAADGGRAEQKSLKALLAKLDAETGVGGKR